MVLKLFISTCLIFILGVLLFAQEPRSLTKIRQIIPLRSTKADVEKIFGKATENYANTSEYKINDDFLTVEYSTGECSSNLATYQVPKGTVIRVNVLLKRAIDFKFVNEDISNFEMEESNDTQNETYKNLIKGVRYDVFVKSKEGVEYDKSPRLLNSMSIFPSNKYSYLECSEVTKQPI
jgi:hypothetical protein